MTLFDLMDQLGNPFDRDSAGLHISRTLAGLTDVGDVGHGGAGFAGPQPWQRFDSGAWTRDSDGDGIPDAIHMNHLHW